MTVTLSIVIPTKDRYECLFVLIESLLKFQRMDFEIIVADNSPDNGAYTRFASRVADPRLRYHHQSRQLSIIENCDIGIGMAQGEVVSMLGDDDGIAEWALDVADWMCDTGVDAVLANRPVYLWPGVTTRVVAGTGRGTFTLEEPTGFLRDLDVMEELSAVLHRGGTELGLIPRVYHGLVRRTALDELRRHSGTCFPGPSPDMANGVGLCRFVRRMTWIDFPVVITGNMPRSGGGMGTKGQHVGKIQERSALPHDTGINWTPYVPKFWSGPTIWAESAMKALPVVDEGLRKRVNFPFLYATCVIFNRRYRDELTDAVRALSRDRRTPRATIYALTAWYLGAVTTLRLQSLLRNLGFRFGWAGHVKRQDLQTIGECMHFLHERYGSRAKPWDKPRAPRPGKAS